MSAPAISMLSCCCFLFFAVALPGQNQSESNAVSEDLAIELEEIVDRYVREYDIPALCVVVTQDGNTTFVNQGHLHRVTPTLVDENTKFQIASLSKMFTGIIVNRLVDAGPLELGTSIVNYLPETYSTKTLRKLEPITVRDLLHHRSGLPRDSYVTRSKRKGNDPLLYEYTEADFETDLNRMKVKPKPGEAFRYSNFGYALLGYIAERASGRTYAELLQEYVVDEYQLRHTSLDVSPQERAATPYRKEDRRIETKAFILGKLVPASGIYSTTADLARLLQLQLEAYAEQQAHPLLLTADVRPKTGVSYGYGLFDFDNGEYGHGGDLDGYASDYWFRAKEQTGFAFLTSSGGDWVPLLAEDISVLLRDSAMDTGEE